jgi:hypothetical protein
MRTLVTGGGFAVREGIDSRTVGSEDIIRETGNDPAERSKEIFTIWEFLERSIERQFVVEMLIICDYSHGDV